MHGPQYGNVLAAAVFFAWPPGPSGVADFPWREPWPPRSPVVWMSPLLASSSSEGSAAKGIGLLADDVRERSPPVRPPEMTLLLCQAVLSAAGRTNLRCLVEGGVGLMW